MTPIKLLALVVATSIFGVCTAQQPSFSNPIDDVDYDDPPSVLHFGDTYYMIVNKKENHKELNVYASKKLSDFRGAAKVVFYPNGEPSENKTAPDVWAPKMHFVDGHLYLYLSMKEDGDVFREYVMKAKNDSDPMGEWEAPAEMLPNWNQDAIDGTVMRHGGKNYFLWNTGHSSVGLIYISEMRNAFELTGPIVVIKFPTERWECEGRCTSEAPYFIYNQDVSYMVITTSAPHHRITYMSIPNDKDPMVPSNWHEFGEVVFDQDPEESVFNVGHASFTDSPDGTETWMLYVANQDGAVFKSYAALEKIDWNADGTPKFPRAHGYNHPQPAPSGEARI